jgi:iron complex transport system ATP-binding protein
LKKRLIDLPLLELNNIKYAYNKTDEDNFKIDVEKWEIDKCDFVSLIGPNGCGKSTLLKLICRLIYPMSGRIKYSGIDISEIPLKEYAKLVAYVPQNNYSIFPFTLYEIVMMGRTPYLGTLGFETKEDKQIVMEALDSMGIADLKSKCINEVSGGEAQRAFIARAIVQKPKLILLDEPNAHLDIEHQISIFELLNQLSINRELTILSVSHDLNLIGLYSQKIAFMDNGKITIQGRKKDVLTENNIRKVFNVESTVFYSEGTNAANILIQPINKN